MSGGPVFRYKAGGGVSVAVFEQTSQRGTTFYSVAAQRAFKRSDDAEWEYTNYMRGKDLLPLAHALTKAHEWIAEREVESNEKTARTAESRGTKARQGVRDDDIPF